MKTIYLIPLILFIAIITILWRGLTLQPALVPSPLINQTAPEFSLPDLFQVGQNINKKALLDKVVLVNFWATWCNACRAEHDYLVYLANDEHIFICGINYKDDITLAKKWLTEHGNPYHFNTVDATGEAAIDWGVYGIPETFILDKQGIIRYKQFGPITPDVWQTTLKPLITRLGSES